MFDYRQKSHTWGKIKVLKFMNMLPVIKLNKRVFIFIWKLVVPKRMYDRGQQFAWPAQLQAPLKVCNNWFNERELGQTPGDSEGQGGLECCSPWSHKELDTTW